MNNIQKEWESWYDTLPHCIICDNKIYERTTCAYSYNSRHDVSYHRIEALDENIKHYYNEILFEITYYLSSDDKIDNKKIKGVKVIVDDVEDAIMHALKTIGNFNAIYCEYPKTTDEKILLEFNNIIDKYKLNSRFNTTSEKLTNYIVDCLNALENIKKI